MKIPTTYAEALEMGYKPADYKWMPGYLSRKTDITKQPVIEARGTRKGDLYVEVPSWKSTQYHHRLYLVKEGA